jgi:VWFA-related protein
MIITCFDEIGGSEMSAQTSTLDQESFESPQTLPKPSKRRLILFLDLFNTSVAEYQRAKRMTDDFLKKVDSNIWDVMLAAIINTGRAGVVVPFGHDIKSISQQLQLLKPNVQRDFSVNSRKRQITELLKTDGTQIEQAYRLASSFARLEKMESEKSIQSFVQLAQFLQKKVSDERVIVVYISGGINLQPGRVYYDIVNQFAGLGSSNQDYTEFALTLPSSVREPNFDIDRKITQSIGVLNKQNITVYCMNTRGSANPADDNIYEQDRTFIVNDSSFLKDYQESLDQIADETGGISFRNSNNLTQGFRDILQDSKHQYVLCYKPPDHKDKGRYHKIKVISLKSEVHLRFRKGYVD